MREALAAAPAAGRSTSGAAWRPTRQRAPLVDLLMRLVRYKPLGFAGGVVILGLLLVGLFAGVLAPYGYNDTTLSARLSPPSPAHLMGTDNTGRDVFSRVIYGAQISMTVGLAGAALHVLVGFVIGATTAFYGGKLDTLVQRVVDGINWTGWAGAWQWTKYVWIDAAMKQAMGH